MNITHIFRFKLNYNFTHIELQVTSEENDLCHQIHPPGAELVLAAPNAGVELACCPKTGAVLVLAPKAGVWEGVAVKGDPKDDPNEGVWLAPNPPEGAELNTNGEGAADGAVRENERIERINTCTDYEYKRKI